MTTAPAACKPSRKDVNPLYWKLIRRFGEHQRRAGSVEYLVQ